MAIHSGAAGPRAGAPASLAPAAPSEAPRGLRKWWLDEAERDDDTRMLELRLLDAEAAGARRHARAVAAAKADEREWRASELAQLSAALDELERGLALERARMVPARVGAHCQAPVGPRAPAGAPAAIMARNLVAYRVAEVFLQREPGSDAPPRRRYFCCPRAGGGVELMLGRPAPDVRGRSGYEVFAEPGAAIAAAARALAGRPHGELTVLRVVASGRGEQVGERMVLPLVIPVCEIAVEAGALVEAARRAPTGAAAGAALAGAVLRGWR